MIQQFESKFSLNEKVGLYKSEEQLGVPPVFNSHGVIVDIRFYHNKETPIYNILIAGSFPIMDFEEQYVFNL